MEAEEIGCGSRGDRARKSRRASAESEETRRAESICVLFGASLFALEERAPGAPGVPRAGGRFHIARDHHVFINTTHHQKGIAR